MWKLNFRRRFFVWLVCFVFLVFSQNLPVALRERYLLLILLGMLALCLLVLLSLWNFFRAVQNVKNTNMATMSLAILCVALSTLIFVSPAWFVFG